MGQYFHYLERKLQMRKGEKFNIDALSFQISMFFNIDMPRRNTPIALNRLGDQFSFSNHHSFLDYNVPLRKDSKVVTGKAENEPGTSCYPKEQGNV